MLNHITGRLRGQSITALILSFTYAPKPAETKSKKTVQLVHILLPILSFILVLYSLPVSRLYFLI
jgi:hypothetical protein